MGEVLCPTIFISRIFPAAPTPTAMVLKVYVDALVALFPASKSTSSTIFEASRVVILTVDDGPFPPVGFQPQTVKS